ncbi:PREDICTED: two-pore potassium channel 3-like isoform X2 [Ipomoea nil]|uniref:two-pore potassium channel 3-like isoform X2 n=1 Tax=Ipomoea nil TaxID=35883 RepID=UPI0009011171|nr:PREDICTED: two-pore potassium channel 3-like isoform X2 [Ipomoea nil]
MEKEPLLQFSSLRRVRAPPPQQPLSLWPLPEHAELTIPATPPHPMTPSEFKEKLIFGGSPRFASTTNLDAFNFNNNAASPSPSCSSSDQRSNNDHLPWPAKPESKARAKSNLHRCRTAPAMATINEVTHKSPPSQQPQFGNQSIVRHSVVLLIIYLALGVSLYTFFRENFTASETHPVVDAIYFCIVTMCTIGYGDITPTTPATKMFSILFVLVGFGFIDILLSGMVGYVLDLQENYLLKTLKCKGAHDPGSYIIDVKKGRMRIRTKVGLALGVVVLCIGIGVGVMHFVERLGWLDSFYLSVMSVTTVGYGDRAFKSLPGRVFASVWLLVSTLAVARAFLYLAEARVDKRHRRMAKWVLDQSMTVSQFLAADIDNNGFVSKPEYVIYKLKEMEKVSEKDILLICRQFDKLDPGNSGKITLADLMESSQ